MSRTMHRILHTPCVFAVLIVSFIARTILAFYDFWQINKDTFNWYTTRIIRDIKCFIPKVIYAITIISVSFPITLAIMLWMIQLSQ